MQKRSKIKWRKSDEQELTKAVRKFNAKRTRIINKFPEMEEFLPDRLSVKDIRENVSTRKEFKKQINSIERFMHKGAEKPIITDTGIKTTAYEKKEVGIKVRALNARRTAERKKADVSTEKGTMGTIRANNLLPKKYDIDKIKKSDWGKFKESVEKQIKDSYTTDRYERYKENYLKGLENAFGSKAENLKRLVENINADVLVQMFYDNPILQIDFIYDPIEMEAKIEAMEENLNEYLQNL